MNYPASLATLAAILLLSACATPPQPRTLIMPPDALEPGIYDVHTGEQLSEAELYGRLYEARFILVGESHTDAWHHEVQERVLRGILEHFSGNEIDYRCVMHPQIHENEPGICRLCHMDLVALAADGGGNLAIGMEMFQRPFQAPLDAFVAGELDEETMLERTEYATRWGYDPEHYRPIWTTARAHGLPLVALNAPRELVRQVARVGVDGLEDDERAMLPELDLSDDAYRDFMRTIFSHHGHGKELDEEAAERFYQAQVVWDETMAQTAVEFMDASPHIAAMLVLAGRGHIERDFGIPPRLRRRLAPQARDQVVSVIPITVPGAAGPNHPHGQSAERLSLGYLQREKIADYVWVGGERAR